MNKARRKKLQEIHNTISEAKECLEILYNDEETYRDNIPENLQNSERYEKAKNATNNIESAISSLTKTILYIEKVLN